MHAGPGLTHPGNSSDQPGFVFGSSGVSSELLAEEREALAMVELRTVPTSGTGTREVAKRPDPSAPGSRPQSLRP